MYSSRIKVNYQVICFICIIVVSLLITNFVISLCCIREFYAEGQTVRSQPSYGNALSNTSLIQITAGRLQDLKFNIDLPRNSDQSTGIEQIEITDLAISLISQSSSLKILGPTTWNVGKIDSGSTHLISTKVYASPSLIGNPVFFTINIQYIKNGQELKSESSDIGAVVIGEIKISANNLGIRFLGDTPNLVGNLLNQGNTPALFTNLEMIATDLIANQTLVESSQFLGTLPVNTPLPFSIPLKLDNDKSSVKYPVLLKITYSDNLKNSHELIINKTISSASIRELELGQFNTINQHKSTSQLANQSSESYLNNGFVDSYWVENVNNSENLSSVIPSNSIGNQKEVGPDEGPSILAIVLSNTAFTDITGITGYLYLPKGFVATAYHPSSNSTYQNFSSNLNLNSPAVASIGQVVKSGQTYTLYFKVNILKSATIGSHNAVLNLYYFKSPDPETGTYKVQKINIPFSLTGKVILDTFSEPTDLIPGEVNKVTLKIYNRGSASANNVIASINDQPESIITTLDQMKTKLADSIGVRTFNIGTINANSTSELTPAILPSFSSAETLQNINLHLTYTDATGETKNLDMEIGFRVLPNPPEAGLTVNPNSIPKQQAPFDLKTPRNGENGIGQSSGLDNNSNNNTDMTTTANSGLSVTPSSLNKNKPTSNDNFEGVKVADIDNNDNDGNESDTINRGTYDKVSGTSLHSTLLVFEPSENSQNSYNKISISENASGGAANKKDTITTRNNNMINNNSRSNSNNINNIDNSITITAGKESNLNFTITNNNRYPILDAIVSLGSQSGSISISGPSKWNLQRLDPGAHQFYSTTVFASTSIIGSPASFEVGAQYIMNGRARNDTFNMGAKVIGEINIDVSNLAINSIAGTPNLVGNLLNKGNTIALFTTIQLLQQSNKTEELQTRQEQFSQASSPSDQDVNSKSVNESSSRAPSRVLVPVSALPSYLGDVDANSPLPFSIPLTLRNDSSLQKYPVSLKITYSDDLRVNHELVINDSVELSQSRQRSGRNANDDQGFLGLLLGEEYSLKLGGFSIPLPILLIVVAVFLAALKIFTKRRKSNTANLYTTARSKDDKFFLDEKGNKDLGTISRHTRMKNQREKTSATEEEEDGKSSDLDWREGSSK